MGVTHDARDNAIEPIGAKMTAIAVDKPCKRAYLGDNTGKLRNINLKNRTVLKELEPHNTEKKKLSSNLRMLYLHKLKKNIYIWNKEFIFR